MTKDSSSPLAWAAFLGISWTWVIGMFLPAVLLRDFGGGAWWLFAVPNVVGAAAMGWVLRTREASTRITTQHATACRAFSVVTIAFHVFFASWYLERLLGGFWAPTTIALITFALFPRTFRFNVGMTMPGMWFLSLAAFVVLYGHGDLFNPVGTASIDLNEAWPGLSAIMLVGFAASPYFDLTFHRARQATNPDGAKIAFGIGFGVVFFSMICFTLAYAALVLDPGTGWPRYVLGVHVALQSALTVWLHGRDLTLSRASERDATMSGRKRLEIFVYLLAAGAGLASQFLITGGIRHAGLEPGEIGYRIFLSAYGLFFPAYAWLCLMTGRNDRRAVAVWLVAVLVALPFYWIAFVERQTNWALIGMAIVLATRVFVRKRSRLASNDV